MERITGKEYLLLQTKRRSKYNNTKVEVDGYVFDSKLEADYYNQLKIREKAGDILFFKIQPKYLLQEAFEKDGKKFSKIEYIADFEIHHVDGTIEVVDTKGFITDVFRIKEKMFNKIYPHKLTVINKSDIKVRWYAMNYLSDYYEVLLPDWVFTNANSEVEMMNNAKEYLRRCYPERYLIDIKNNIAICRLIKQG